MSVVVVATFQPAPGKIDDVIEVLTSVIPDVHEEDGCELYALHRGDDTLVFIEKWASPEALSAHSGGTATAGVGPRMKGLLAGRPQITVLEAVPAGTAEQGVL